MKSQYFNLPMPFRDLASVDWKFFSTFQRPFKDLVYTAAGLSLLFMLGSCGEKPAGRLKISNDLTMMLTKQVPSRQATGSDAVRIESDFGKTILQAVEASEEYRAALSLEQALVANIGGAESVRRWQVTGTSTAGAVREKGGTKSSDTTTGIAGGIQASRLIYDGGESVANINSTTAKAVGARVDRIIIGNELAFEAARAWINVWQYERKLDLLKARSTEMETVASQIKRMASNGMIDRATLDSMLRKILTISLERTRLQSDLSQAQVRFARFFDQKSTGLEMPTELLSMSDTRAQAAAWQDAPDLQRSAVELIVAQNSVLAAKAAFRPKAKVQAGVTSPMQNGESTDTSLGIALGYTFSDGGLRKSELDAAEARLDSANASLLGVQRSLKAEMDVAVQQLKAIEQSIPLLEQQITLSASVAKTAKTQLTTGQAKLNEVIEAQIENYRAEDRQITVLAEQRISKLMIASRTGLLGRLINLPTDIAE